MSELYWGHHLEGCSLIDIRLPIFNTHYLHRSVGDSLVSRCIRSCEDSMMNVRCHLLKGLMLVSAKTARASCGNCNEVDYEKSTVYVRQIPQCIMLRLRVNLDSSILIDGSIELF